VGYGVELAHLIDIHEMEGIAALAQVDLDIRVHRNQSTAALGKMAYGILGAFFSRAERYGNAKLLKELGDRHIALEREDAAHRVIPSAISGEERPPMIEIPEYREKFGRGT
jgi:glucosyl-3-phosphoglycerate synthase